MASRKHPNYFSAETVIELDVPSSVEQVLQLDDTGCLAVYDAKYVGSGKGFSRLRLPPAQARKIVQDAEYFGEHGTGASPQARAAAYRWARKQRGELDPKFPARGATNG